MKKHASIFVAIVLSFAALRFAHKGLYLGLKPAGGDDFRPGYVAALAIRDGGDPYDETIALPLARATTGWEMESAFEFNYAPPTLFLYGLLSFLPYPVAVRLWLVLGLLAMAGVFVLCSRALRLGREERLVLAVFLLALPAVAQTLRLGQANMWVVLGVAGMMACLARGRDTAAGICLAFAILFKVTPAIFLAYLLLRRRWRALGGCAIALVLLLGAAWWCFGEHASPLRWAREVETRFEIDWLATFFMNQSIACLFRRLLGDAGTLPGNLVRGTILLGTLAAWARRRRPDDPESLALGTGLGAVTALLVSPISLSHHYAIMVIPVAGIAATWPVLSPRVLRGGAALCAGGLLLEFDLLRPGEGLPSAAATVLGFPLVFLAAGFWIVLLAAHLGRGGRP